MSGLLPDASSGGIIVRDADGNCLPLPPSVVGSYCPPETFTSPCLISALPATCASQITSEQINSIVSELLCFMATLNPTGEYDCASVCNLATNFEAWATAMAPSTPEEIVTGICADNEAHDALAACLISSDPGNALGAGADGGLFVVAGGGGGIPEAPLDGQQYARQSATWTLVTGSGTSYVRNVLDYGAVPDGIFINTNASIASGSAALTTTGTAFVPGDVGKVITVTGAGVGAGFLHTTIATVVSGTSITVATPASTTLSAAAIELFYGTNNTAAFQAALTAAKTNEEIIVPIANWGLLTPLAQSSKRVHWTVQPGARFNVPSAANAFNGVVTLLDYASARDEHSAEYWSTNKVGGEAGKYWNWNIGVTGTPYSYQKNALQIYVLQNDPSSGLGNGDPGPNISRDGVAADLRSYIGSGNMTGRAFGLNVIAAHQGVSEGMLSGIEVDIFNGASNVPSFDDNTVDFPKSGIGVVSKGPNNVTMAYHFMEGGGKFYVGYYGTVNSLVDHPESRFIKLKDMFSVYRHGHVTVGKDHADLYLTGVELDPAGYASVSGPTGGLLNLINSGGNLSPAEAVGNIHFGGLNAAGTSKNWGSLIMLATAVGAGAERSSLIFTALNGAGSEVGVASLDVSGLILTGGGILKLNALAGPPGLQFQIAGVDQSSIDDNGGSINVKSNAAGSQGMYILHGASAWTAISDERLPYKKTARALTVLDRLDDISLYENEVEGRLELFVKAQELHKAFPHLVNVGSGADDYEPTGLDDPHVWGVSYERAGVVALQGLKELYAIVARHERLLDL